MLTWLEWSPASDDPTLFPLILRAGGCCGLAGGGHVSYQCGGLAEVVSALLRNREPRRPRGTAPRLSYRAVGQGAAVSSVCQQGSDPKAILSTGCQSHRACRCSAQAMTSLSRLSDTNGNRSHRVTQGSLNSFRVMGSVRLSSRSSPSTAALASCLVIIAPPPTGNNRWHVNVVAYTRTHLSKRSTLFAWRRNHPALSVRPDSS
jgi:hypothetical protein